jgi:hypothetical protein
MKRHALFALCVVVAMVVALLSGGRDARADIPTISYTFSQSTLGRGPIINIAGQSTCAITVYSVGGGATLVPQAASDGIVNGQTQPPSLWSTATTVGGGSITSAGSYVGNIASAGITNFSYNLTALTSGAVSGVIACGPSIGTSTVVVASLPPVTISPLPLPVALPSTANVNIVASTALPVTGAFPTPIAGPYTVNGTVALSPNPTVVISGVPQVQVSGPVTVNGTVALSPAPTVNQGTSPWVSSVTGTVAISPNPTVVLSQTVIPAVQVSGPVTVNGTVAVSPNPVLGAGTSNIGNLVPATVATPAALATGTAYIAFASGPVTVHGVYATWSAAISTATTCAITLYNTATPTVGTAPYAGPWIITTSAANTFAVPIPPTQGIALPTAFSVGVATTLTGATACNTASNALWLGWW